MLSGLAYAACCDARAMTTPRPDIAWRFGLGAVALWSTVATAFKFSLNHLSPTELLWIASLSSWLFLAGFIAITGEWRRWSEFTTKTCLTGISVGLLNPTLYYLLLFAAYDRLPAQEAMAINYSWALTLALLAGPVLKQHISRWQWLAAGVSYLGVLVIATRGAPLTLEFESPTGVGLAVASTLVWSAYWMINTRLTLPPVSGLFLNFTGGVLATSALVVWQGLGPLAITGVSGAIYVGLFEMGASFVLWLLAMRHTTNTLRISSLIFLSPPLSLLLIWLILDEPIRTATLVGLGLILLGLGLQQAEKARFSRPPVNQ